MAYRILLVDDDPQALESTRKILELSGYEVVTAMDGQAALDTVRPGVGRTPQRFDVVLTDVRMPKLGGLEFLRALSLCGEKMPVVLMTAYGRVEDAVWAMKLGAVDFLSKPFKRQTLLAAVTSAIKRAGAMNPAAGTPAPSDAAAGTLLVGQSEGMKNLRNLIQQVAPSAATVLLTGESGTGKELVASCLHRQSARAEKRFVAINCAAIPEQLLESELFGFEKGTFTGAGAAKEGLIESAEGGTLLLDEIGDMPLSLQGKLLRVLQESEVRRLGATNSHKVNVRIIAATHRDLHEAVRNGTFRQDLLFRLEVIAVHIPPLREHMMDLPDLAYRFLQAASVRHGKEIVGIHEDTMEILLAHSWPGNVRELSNVIERGVVFSTEKLLMPGDLPPHLVALFSKTSLTGTALAHGTISVPLGTSLKDVEELLIRRTLEATSGDKNMTAKLLGINSRTIYRKLDKRGDPT